MAKKNKIAIIKEPNCLNCGYPFTKNEKFCPECGQKNKGKKITLASFIREVFAGFFSWDAKFWRTLIPLLINPGKVSKNYIEGKRDRYTNPFRFYITVSLIFFLILGLTESYSKFTDLQENKETIANINDFESKDIDSIQSAVIRSLNTIDSTNTTKDNFNVNLISNDSTKIGKFLKFHKNNPKATTNQALDSLRIDKNFTNKFWYSRLSLSYDLLTNKETNQQFFKQLISYTSIALFILLPLFTLFLKFFYIRRKYTYIEHLIFVFHTQTVFFILLSIFYVLGFINNAYYVIPLFFGLFCLYLFIAMKSFYEQGNLKTFVKFCLANFVFFILGTIGGLIVSFIAFALY